MPNPRTVKPGSITFIKYNQKKVHVKWTKEGVEGHAEERELKCADPPNEDFRAKLQECLDDALGIVELPDDYAENARVNRVKIDEQEEGLAAEYHIVKTVEGISGAFNLHTPKAAITSGAQTRLVELTVEAANYVDGERATGNLFQDEPSGDGQATDEPTPEPEPA